MHVEYEEFKKELYKEKLLGHKEGVEDTVKALIIILKEDMATVSILQSSMGFPYSKGASIIDELEKVKLIAPFNNIKPRQVFVQWKKDRRIQRGKIKKINKRRVTNRAKNLTKKD